jgi:SAM-dependent methyltransferase
MTETITRWDNLHRQKRHQLRYPSEHVVRWLAGLQIEVRGKPSALDIGCGGGRHMRVLEEFGFQPAGVDISEAALRQTLDWTVWAADMCHLPYHDETFDVALAFGVFYYGTTDDHKQAISELYRVLKPGGHALVVTRTLSDSRSHGEFERVVTEGDEAGMTMNFTAQEDIRRNYRLFSRVSYERTETTRDNRKWEDSDWLISVTK